MRQIRPAYSNLPMRRQINILHSPNENVAEFSSKVTIARPKSPSLRTTIPEAVVKMMELSAGNAIVWNVKPAARGIEVSLSKA